MTIIKAIVLICAMSYSQEPVHTAALQAQCQAYYAKCLSGAGSMSMITEKEILQCMSKRVYE